MSTIKELAERAALDRGRVSDLVHELMEEGWVKALRSKKTGVPRWELTEEGSRVLPPSSPEGYASIGGRDAQGLALAARDFYLSKGWFFALARQDAEMKRKVDCVAYDYDNGLAVGVEVESSRHVLHDHLEQVKQHMLEIAPFKELHFWARGEAAERISELRTELRPEDQSKVKVFAVEEEPPL